MKFTPMTEKEIAEAGLLPAGEYDFEIAEAHETISKSSGNEMIHMRVAVFDHNGARRMMDDYLVDGPKSAFKIRHLAEALGMLPAYERGEMNADDLTGQAGRCKVRIQKDTNGQYPDKNTTADYVKVAGSSAAASPRQSAPPRQTPPPMDDDSDSIPF